MAAGSPQAVAVELPLNWSYFIDEAGRLSLDETLFPTQQARFAAYDPWQMPRQNGTLWMRLDLAAVGASQGSYLLDLNTYIVGQIPDTPQVWYVAMGSAAGTLLEPVHPGLYALPSPLPTSGFVYVRTPGVAAPGFMPQLRAASGVNEVDAKSFESVQWFLFGLFVLTLLRGVFERREWRLWASLYTGAVLVQVFWGLPATPRGGLNLWDLPGLLAPGVALLILPHVGRHLLRSRYHSPFIDMQLIILGIPGLILALAPLVPGYGWTLRYLPFWPLLMLLLVPTVLGALFKNLSGSCRFLCICLFPPLALLAGLGLAPLAFVGSNGLAVSVVSCLPWLGLGASVLLVAFVPTPTRLAESAGKEPGQAGHSRNGAKKDSRQRAGAAHTSAALSMDTDTLALTSLSPLSIMADKSGSESAGGLALVNTGTESPRTVPVTRDTATQSLEADLRELVDALFVDITALDQCRLSDDARAHSDALARAGHRLTKLVHGLPERMGATLQTVEASGSDRFDLRQLMLEAHNAVSPLAEAKNLALSWFSAPHLHRYYEGDCSMLYNVLMLLGTSAVSATSSRGMVQIRAQRVSESNDPGQLVFSVTDSGSGTPPFSRGAMALVRAWELVGASGGTLRMDSGPTGTVVTFSVRFQAVSSAVPLPDMSKAPSMLVPGSPEGAETTMDGGFNAPVLRVIVASDVPANRQLMAYYLDELPHEVLEARSAGEAVSLYTRTPGALLLFDGDMHDDDMTNAIAAVRVFEGEHAYPPTSIVVLVNDEGQSSRLRRAGSTHTLFKPILRTELRHLVLRLVPLPKPRRLIANTAQETRKTASTAKGGVKAGQQAVMEQTATQPLQLLPELSLTPTESEPAPEKKKWGLLPTFGRNQEKTAKAAARKNAERKTESAVPVADAQGLAVEQAPGKLEVSSGASPKMFSNVGNPMPMVKPKGEAVSVSAQGAAPSSGTIRKPAPALFSHKEDWEKIPPSPMFSGRESGETMEAATSAEWVGEPMPIVPSAGTAEWVGDPMPVVKKASPEPKPVTKRVDSSAPADTVEWVGEPMPIAKPANERQVEVNHAKPAGMPGFSKTGTKHSAPADTVEWVGEPMPIIKTPSEPEQAVRTDVDSAEWVGEPMPIVPVNRETAAVEVPIAEPEIAEFEPLSMPEMFAVTKVAPAVLSDNMAETVSGNAAAFLAPHEPVQHTSSVITLGFEPDDADEETGEETRVLSADVQGNSVPDTKPEFVVEPLTESFFGESLGTARGESEPDKTLPETAPEIASEPESASPHISRGPNRLYLPGMGLPDIVTPDGMPQDEPERAITMVTERVAGTEPVVGREDAANEASVTDPETFASAFVPVAFTPVEFPSVEPAHEVELSLIVSEPLSVSSPEVFPEHSAVTVEDAESSDSFDDAHLTENLARLDAAFEDVQAGIASENVRAVLAAASALSMAAETLGLHMLAGQARCMEDLADAGEMSAILEFLPELQEAVTRQRDSF